MTHLVSVHDRQALADFLGKDSRRHIYALGDLDPFFWPSTQWYGLKEDRDGPLLAVALLYLAPNVPTLLALDQEPQHLRDLLEKLGPLLPRRFYAHIEHGLETIFQAQGWRMDPNGPHHRMALVGQPITKGIDTSRVQTLTEADLPELLEFYAHSYPGNWFDPRMLQTGRYVGIRGEDGLRAVAGIHVHSLSYAVAALGNITTAPEHRRKGLGKATVAALVDTLHQEVDEVALNVHADNHGAIALYRALGFEIHCSFLEAMFSIPPNPNP